MIRADWPTCFPDDVIVAVSSTNDGTMLDRSRATHDKAVLANRERFAETLDMRYSDMVNQWISYGDDKTYAHIAEVGLSDTKQNKEGIEADALMTDAANVGLFLPVADCIPTVIYDPALKRLALLHLGRHSTIAKLMEKTITTLKSRGSNPADLIVWFGPSVQKESYRLAYFTPQQDPEWASYIDHKEDGIYIDMQGYNRSQALKNGVKAENIFSSTVNTATSDHYFSHSHGDTTGRFAVVAVRKA